MPNVKPVSETIEAMIARSSLSAVLAALATVCSEKAAHIGASFADAALAREWDAAGHAIDDLIARLPHTPGIV